MRVVIFFVCLFLLLPGEGSSKYEEILHIAGTCSLLSTPCNNHQARLSGHSHNNFTAISCQSENNYLFDVEVEDQDPDNSSAKKFRQLAGISSLITGCSYTGSSYYCKSVLHFRNPLSCKYIVQRTLKI